MVNDLFATVEREDLDGVIPISNPEELLIGYVAALPRSKRTEKHEWWVSIADVKRRGDDPRFKETNKKLQELTARAMDKYNKE